MWILQCFLLSFSVLYSFSPFSIERQPTTRGISLFNAGMPRVSGVGFQGCSCFSALRNILSAAASACRTSWPMNATCKVLPKLIKHRKRSVNGSGVATLCPTGQWYTSGTIVGGRVAFRILTTVVHCLIVSTLWKNKRLSFRCFVSTSSCVALVTWRCCLNEKGAEEYHFARCCIHCGSKWYLYQSLDRAAS